MRDDLDGHRQIERIRYAERFREADEFAGVGAVGKPRQRFPMRNRMRFQIHDRLKAEREAAVGDRLRERQCPRFGFAHQLVECRRQIGSWDVRAISETIDHVAQGQHMLLGTQGFALQRNERLLGIARLDSAFLQHLHDAVDERFAADGAEARIGQLDGRFGAGAARRFVDPLQQFLRGLGGKFGDGGIEPRYLDQRQFVFPVRETGNRSQKSFTVRRPVARDRARLRLCQRAGYVSVIFRQAHHRQRGRRSVDKLEFVRPRAAARAHRMGQRREFRRFAWLKQTRGGLPCQVGLRIAYIIVNGAGREHDFPAWVHFEKQIRVGECESQEASAIGHEKAPRLPSAQFSHRKFYQSMKLNMSGHTLSNRCWRSQGLMTC